jgi:hypothetical protein
MGFFDDLQNKASELLGGADIPGNVEDITNSAQDAGAGVQDGAQDAVAGAQDSLQGLSTDVQEQITQFASEHNISIEAAKDHILGNN